MPHAAVALLGLALIAATMGTRSAALSPGVDRPGMGGASAPGSSASPGSNRDPVDYGLAEPAGALPGTQGPGDVAAWSAIRDDLDKSGACWLRSDLDTWLSNAIAAFGWLGSRSPCRATSGGPVKVLAILDQQTVWAARRLCPNAAFSATYRVRRIDFTLDDWRALVRCVAGRFAGRISAYEIWNEPLLADSMLGYEDGSATHYFDLLRVAYVEIKSADPEATVLALGGSDLYAGGDQARMDQMRAFTTGLVALGAARYADAISLHGYPWDRAGDSVWMSYREQLRFHEQAWGKPVWITETGERTTDHMTQSAYLSTAYGLFVDAGVRHIFWFSITDQPDGEFGLRGRPVEPAMRAFAEGQARTTS